MQTANEYLHAILQVVGKIEQNQSKGKSGSGAAATGEGGNTGIGSIASQLGQSVKSFAGVKKGARNSFFSFLRGMIDIAKKSKDKDVNKVKIIAESMNIMGAGLPSVAEGLGELGKIRTKRVERALRSLQLLYEFMYDAGDPRKSRRVDRGVKTFQKMGRALRDIARPIRSITMSFMYLGLGILAFAGSILLTSMMLQLGKPTDVLMFLGVTILGLVIMFGILALARKVVDRGTDTIKDIGIGMVTLSLGILGFALVLRILPKILGSESGGSIAKSLLIMFGIVAVSVGMFALIGLAAPLIKKGTGVVFLMSLGILALSVAIIGLATAAKYLMGGSLTVGVDKKSGKQQFGDAAKTILGLGGIAVIVLAATAMFVLLGSIAILILPGIGISIAMSIALILLAKSTVKLVEASKKLEGVNVAGVISNLIGGVITGFLDGLSTLAGEGNALQKMKNFIKNSVKIFAGVGVLMAMSVALSQFAKAISAFAELENMRIIEGYDKDGKPIFGAKVNVTKVGENITTTISSFLLGLIASTDGLTRQQAGAIKKMGRALTGKRGILSAVIQFASALKMYAEFGESNEIGYVEYDEKGNEIHKKVAASIVVDNMIGSFLYFTNKLFSRTEEEFGDGEPGITGRQKRRMRRMSKALVGKNGILGAVMKFSETLQMFSKFGVDNELPLLDADGKPTGETISVGDIADNIVKTLTTFSDTLADKLEKGKVKDASKALSKYDKMIDKLAKLSSSMDGLTRMAASVQDLADGVGDLAVNLDKLDTDKLGVLADKIMQASYESATRPQATRSAGSFSTALGGSPSSSTVTKTGEPNWEVISAQIGQAVGGQVVAAIKAGQMKFEFSPSGVNQGVVEFA